MNAWDYDLALGVHYSFEKALIANLQKYIADLQLLPEDFDMSVIKELVRKYRTAPDEPIHYAEHPTDELRDVLTRVVGDCQDLSEYGICILANSEDMIIQQSIDDTIEETYQAMEAAIHNLNTLHSRAGSQVPFSSINFGTDTSDAGRLIIRKTLEAVDAGMGNGETAIFPISIFKVYDGINFKPGDPNYDLYRYAMEVTARRLFPNFVFGDAPFNYQYYKPGHPETEIVAMGQQLSTLRPM